MTAKMPHLEAVQSGAIHSIGHHNGDLYVKFPSGDVWRYKGLSRANYDEMKGSGSVGKYFHQYVKPNHEGEKVS